MRPIRRLREHSPSGGYVGLVSRTCEAADYRSETIRGVSGVVRTSLAGKLAALVRYVGCLPGQVPDSPSPGFDGRAKAVSC